MKFSFKVKWRDIDYNIGNHFNGTIFTAPLTGLYSFHASAEQYSSHNTSIFVYINGSPKTQQESKNGSYRNVTIQTTLKIDKEDKVEIRFKGYLSGYNDGKKTFFEGRLISRMDK